MKNFGLKSLGRYGACFFCHSSSYVPAYCRLGSQPGPTGTIAQTIGSWAHPDGFRVKAELCGTEGMLTYDSADAPIAVMPRQHGKKSSNAVVPSSPVDKSPYQLEWEDFIAHIGGHAPARVTPEDALAALHIAECALKSAKTGAPVTV